MEIFEHGGDSVQTFGCTYTVWYYSGGRLIEVAQFEDLKDAEIFVDAVAERDLAEGWLTTYTIVYAFLCRPTEEV